MAYATIAGLPVEMGLYAGMALTVVYAVLGTSRVLMVTVTSAISLLTATTLAAAVPNGDSEAYLTAAATLALLVGLFLILAGILRLGVLANLISQPVLIGFKAGIGVVILVGQSPKLLGVSIDDQHFFREVADIFRSLSMVHWVTVAVGFGTLVILIFLPRISNAIPATLVAVAVGILISALLNLESEGVAVVGNVPSGLPRPELPDTSLVSQLWPGALGIALMSFIESNAASRTFLRKGEPPINANQELVALGVANVASGVFQAYPGGGGTSQTVVNRQAGAKTQLTGIIFAATVVLTLLFFSRPIAYMPEATLGALVMMAVAGLIKVKDFRAIQNVRLTEFVWAIVAFAGVVVLGTLEGILIAVVLSVLTVIYQSSYPPVYALGRKPDTDVFRPLSEEHPDDQTFPGLLMIRTEGRMNFASTPNIKDEVWELINENEPRIVAIDLSAVPDLEYTALQLLTEFEDQLSDAGITLWLAALNPEPLRIVENSPLGETLGHERMFFNVEQVVETYTATNATNAQAEPSR